MFFLQDQEWLSYLMKSAHMHKVRLMNNLVKGPKKNDDKSAEAMLKNNELHDRTGQSVVCRDKSHERHGKVVCSSSSTRQLGCVFRDMEPPKSVIDFAEELRHTENNPTCEIHESCCTSRKHSRPKSFARTDLPR